MQLLHNPIQLNPVASLSSHFIKLLFIVKIQKLRSIKVVFICRFLLGFLRATFENFSTEGSRLLRQPFVCGVFDANFDGLIGILLSPDIEVDFVVEKMVMRGAS